MKTTFKDFLFENNINDYFKTVIFDKLPFEYKKSIVIYMYEGDVDVDWSFYDIIDWNDNKKVDILIDDYSKKFGLKNYEYGLVPTDIIKDKIKHVYDQDSFDEYHKWYGQTKDHGSSILPILVSDKNDEYIEDGWHRFHSYIDKNLVEIPVVKL